MEEVGDATLGEAGMASKLLVGGREAVFGEGAGDTDSSGAVAQKGGTWGCRSVKQKLERRRCEGWEGKAG